MKTLITNCNCIFHYSFFCNHNVTQFLWEKLRFTIPLQRKKINYTAKMEISHEYLMVAFLLLGALVLQIYSMRIMSEAIQTARSLLT